MAETGSSKATELAGKLTPGLEHEICECPCHCPEAFGLSQAHCSVPCCAICDYCGRRVKNVFVECHTRRHRDAGDKPKQRTIYEIYGDPVGILVF